MRPRTQHTVCTQHRTVCNTPRSHRPHQSAAGVQRSQDKPAAVHSARSARPRPAVSFACKAHVGVGCLSRTWV
eukprot:366109-Chlamydomonas_euryale.AAC.2